MSFDNRDSIDFGKEEIPKLFRSIFIPTLLGMLFNVAFTLTDGIFVGNGIGPDGLASINLSCPIMMIITGLGIMFASGSSVVAAIHLSKGNKKAAQINITQAYISSILIASIAILFLIFFSNSILRLIGVTDNLFELAEEYYFWFLPTCLFLMIQIVGEFIIRLDGSPKFAMYANILPAVINIILDYIFIFPCKLGIKGAALATDIGTGVGMLMTFYYMVFMSKDLRFYKLKRSFTSLRLSMRNIGYMMKIGFTGFIGEFAISVMMVTGNIMFGKYLGDEGIAAYGVICYLFPVVYMVYCAVSSSSQPIISFNYGARQYQRVKDTFRHSTLISIVFGLLVTLVFWLFSTKIISIFLTNTTEAFQLASKGLPLYSIGFVFVAFNVSAIGYFQSIEKAFSSIVLMILRGIVFLIISFLICPKLFGTMGLWIAVPIGEILTSICGILFLSIKNSTQQSS